MLKYVFIVLILIGCSNSNIKKIGNKDSSVGEKYLLLRGANLYSLGRKKEALSLYDEVLKNNKKNVMALREKGIIEGQFGNLVQAEKNLKKAVELNPTDIIALKNLSYIYFDKKDYDKSLYYMKDIPQNIKNEQDYFILGYIEFLNKNYVQSLNYYMNIESDEIFSKKNFFDSYLKTIEKTQNLNDNFYLSLEEKIKYNKTNTMLLAEFYEKSLNQDYLAERTLKKYIVNNDVDRDIINELIKIYKKNGKKEEAKKALMLVS